MSILKKKKFCQLFSKNNIVRWWEDGYKHKINQQGKNMYNIESTSVTNCQQFNCSQHNYNIRFDAVNKTFGEAHEEINKLFIDLHNKFLNLMGPNDYIRIVFFHNDFARPIGFKFFSKKEYSSYDMRQTFEHITQSYRTIEFNKGNALRASVIIAHIPSGGHFTFQPINSHQILFNSKSSIFVVENTDNRCLLKAIIIAIAFESGDKKIINKVTKKHSSFLHKEAKKISKKCCVPNIVCSYPEIKKFEAYFKEYQIMIIDNSGLLKEPIYLGPPNNKHIYISFTNTHYNVIKSICSFFGSNYYCHFCKKPYKQIGRHQCPNICRLCHIQTCQIDKTKIFKCQFCNKTCQNAVCQKYHESQFCYVNNICKECGFYISKHHKHVCTNQKYCSNCKIVVDLQHKCYILTESEKKVCRFKKSSRGLIFFDYETYQLECEHTHEKRHVTSLVIAEKVCEDCLNNVSCLSDCGVYKFYDNNNFNEWLFSPKNEGYTALAHNMQGFDGLFIMKYIKESKLSRDKMPNVLVNGTKILTLTFRNVKILDSFAFIPLALSKFPETFNLKELKKGFMCHLFASPSNFNYIGPMPDKKYYAPNLFSSQKKLEFDIWYSEKSQFLFNYKKELEEYCLSDVKLLKEGCLVFRKIILDITGGIDCFSDCITLASLCMLIYRSNHMIPKTIGIIPVLGFNSEQKSSNACFQWLKFIMHTQQINIQHFRNGGEQKFANFRVDGYHKDSKTIYEFYGCYYHGCPRCFTQGSFNKQRQLLQSTIYKKHVDRIKNLKEKNKDHVFIEMWECDFNKLKKESPELRSFLISDKCDILDRLDPRDSLFGGRTNAIKMYHKVEPNEEILYVDFRSLYPYCQKYGIFPVGQPKIITENFDDVTKYFGLIKCKVLAPRKLFFPVLPAKINNKLFFTLCKMCAEENNPTCNHSPTERAFIGSWTSLELQKAIQSGYKIVQIYEVWHYENTAQYDINSKTGGLFTSYVDTFLKLKEEASGWPQGINTPEEKQNYIDNFFELEGIRLDENNIEKNSGLRSVVKLILNSLWGKFGMRTNRTQVKFINNIREWYEMINNSDYEIHDINFDIPNILTVYFSISKQSYDGDNSDNNINVVIASFVTAQARLVLLDAMEKVGERTLYHDTGDYLNEIYINFI